VSITEIVAKRLKLFSKRRVVNLLDGNYDSIFKGKGVEFQSLRDYVAGDDVRSIDWRATARTGRTQTRLYAPLRDQRIVVIADTSPSMHIPGYTGISKKDALYGLVVALGMFVHKNRDLLAVCYNKPNGRILTSKFGNTNKHIEQSLRTIDESMLKTPPQNAHNLEDYLQHIVSHLRQRSAIFIVTDSFHDLNKLKQYITKLSARHQVFVLQISPSWPFSNDAVDDKEIVDIETGEKFLSELASSKKLQDEWKAMFGEYTRRVKKLSKSLGVPYGLVEDVELLPEELRKMFIQSRVYAKRH
jgi:uncharacterized protein (DUF58 family)